MVIKTTDKFALAVFAFLLEGLSDRVSHAVRRDFQRPGRVHVDRGGAGNGLL